MKRDLWEKISNGEDSLCQCQECGNKVDVGYESMLGETYFICVECYEALYCKG